MKKIIALAVLGLGLTANAQTLLYQWAFTNSLDNLTNSAPSYAITPGTGGLVLQNVAGNVFGTIGTDGINPPAYFTNSSVGPGSGPGVDARGALVANGQGYSGGSTAIALATNLNLGSLNQLTVTFWVQLGTTTPGQFPRFVQFYQTPAFDVGGKGSGNHNGVGASVNGWSGAIAGQEQNGIANGSSAQQAQVTISGNAALAPGFQADGATWYFEAITYDGALTANNFTTWIGSLSTNVQPFVLSANYSSIIFTTNATVMIGGNNVSSAPRGLSSGALADVRIYSGVLTSNMLENIRNFLPDGVIPPGSLPASVSIQPVSGSTFAGGTRTFSVAPAGNPAVFSYLWRSNGVAVGTNASLTVNNVKAAANGATFVCSVTNYLAAGNILGGTNSTPATLTVLAPAAGSYAEAIFTNNPFSFWLVNEPTNTTTLNLSDYANGHDGQALIPTNNAFVTGPTSPMYPGFDANNTSIETISFRHCELNLANPVNFPNTGMTICGWVNTPVIAGANGLIFDLVSDTAGGFGLLFGPNNSVEYQWGQNTPTFTSGISFNPNEWTFVALVISTNLTQMDIDGSVAADTNATIYVGAHSLGLQSATDSTAFGGDAIASGTSASALCLGRTSVAASENSPTPYAVNTAQFNAVTVFYSALSAETITNLYLKGAGIYIYGAPDENTVGNILLTYPLGALQQAATLTGPYTDVIDPNTTLPAVSPYSIPMTNSQDFFRVR